MSHAQRQTALHDRLRDVLGTHAAEGLEEDERRLHHVHQLVGSRVRGRHHAAEAEEDVAVAVALAAHRQQLAEVALVEERLGEKRDGLVVQRATGDDGLDAADEVTRVLAAREEEHQQLRGGDMVLLKVRNAKERNRLGVGKGEDCLTGLRPEGGVEGIRERNTVGIRLEEEIGGLEDGGAGTVVILLDLVDAAVVSLCE